MAELIVLWSFSIQKWYVCSSIRNWIAYANEANIVNKDSPIRQVLGIHNFRERRTRFIWLTKQNQNILLHETHSTQGNEASWKREWGARLVGSHGVNNATRVAILKALVNEDTLLRTHCYPRCFLGCANWETFVADTNVSEQNQKHFLCPGHKICVRARANGETFVSATMCPRLPGP